MSKTYLKSGELIGYAVRTLDGETAALRDLILDLDDWLVRYLAVEAGAWTPGHEVMLPPRSLADIDESRHEIHVRLTGAELRESPSLAIGSGVVRDFEERFQRFRGWRDQWRSEIDAESVEDPPMPAAPPATEPVPGEANAETPGLARLEELRTWTGETSDGQPARIDALLIDDSDWSLPYLELRLEDPPDMACLVQRVRIAWADPAAQRLYLSATARELLQAELQPYPTADAEGRETRVLEARAA